MAITLTLETGAGVSGANTFAALATAQAYAEAHVGGATWLASDEEKQKASLVQATRMLCQRLTWKGYKVAVDQATVFPRNYLYDSEGNLFDSDVVPQQVVDATCELAIQLVSEDFSQDAGGAVIREKVDVLEVQYAESSTRRRAPFPQIVLDMVYPLATLITSGPHRLSRG